MSLSLAEADTTTLETEADEAAGGLWSDAFKRLRRNPAAIIGAILVVLFLAVAIFAPWLAPYDPAKQVGFDQIRPSYVPGPSSQHWLGLDTQGRDELSRMIFGARQSLIVAVVSVTIAGIVGSILGLLAGAFGGWVDNLVMRIVDIMLAVPGLLFAIGVAALLGQSLKGVMIAIATVNVPIFARLLRGSMLVQRGSDYALAAQALGVKKARIVFGHVLPNSLSPVIVQATLSLATAIIEAAALSFLGLGDPDLARPEWGAMLANAQRFLSIRPELAIYPALCIIIVALGFTLLGESLREALDPKFRR
jgi:peptide/nickel transport system permease protein